MLSATSKQEVVAVIVSGSPPEVKCPPVLGSANVGNRARPRSSCPINLLSVFWDLVNILYISVTAYTGSVVPVKPVSGNSWMTPFDFSSYSSESLKFLYYN